MGVIEKGGHLILTRKQRYCVVCGKPISVRRRSYCSDECYEHAMKLRMANDKAAARELGIEYEDYVRMEYD